MAKKKIMITLELSASFFFIKTNGKLVDFFPNWIAFFNVGKQIQFKVLDQGNEDIRTQIHL